MARFIRIVAMVMGGLASLAGLPAMAAAGNTTVLSGVVGAIITAPVQLVAVSPLQFGALLQPVTGGTLTVSPSGAVTTTGDVGTARAIAQPNAPAPATFNLTGLPGTLFAASGVSQVTISNGSKTMTVGQFTISGTSSGGIIGLNGTATFTIGGTLTVAPGQAIGTYSGIFPITVTYF